MATRRVRRIKRGSKKRQSHHGRKTKRHHKRDNRTNKRHSGGMKSFAKMFTDKLNPRGGRLYGGIEVFKGVAADGVARYYIGNRPIAEYEASTMPADKAYGKLIRSKLTGIDHFVDAGSTFTGITFMDKANFDKFEQEFPSAPSSAAAAAEEDEPNRGVILENVTGSGKMILHFGPKSHDLMPDRPLKISIPSPPSGNSPVKELIFLGNESGITVTFMMKKNETTYCALWTYDRRNQYMTNINYTDPSITKPLVLKSERRNNITDQIIPIIDQLAEASNGCDLDAASAYYAHSNVRDVDKSIKEQILALFSLSGKMSGLSMGAN